MDPRILTGPPGCGKSHWIQKYAESVQKQLFVCPCRKDRTLREGRQKLHLWARRTEPAILWLEGADDLTPEAQAFLRRILETHAKEVQFILECRDAGRLQEPIRSRCRLQRFPLPSWKMMEEYARTVLDEKEQDHIQEIYEILPENEYSYRRIQQCIYLIQYDPQEWSGMVAHRRQEKGVIARGLSSKEWMSYLREGYHPERLIATLLSEDDTWRTYGECVEVGGSRWAFLGSALDRRAITPAEQEE
jgi:hypothetical protein